MVVEIMELTRFVTSDFNWWPSVEVGSDEMHQLRDFHEDWNWRLHVTASWELLGRNSATVRMTQVASYTAGPVTMLHFLYILLYCFYKLVWIFYMGAFGYNTILKAVLCIFTFLYDPATLEPYTSTPTELVDDLPLKWQQRITLRCMKY